MTAKHTPTPWTLFETPNDPDFTHEIQGIAAIYAGDGSAAANAAFIMRAVNYHEEFVAALEAAIECGLVPSSSVADGGASKYARSVHVADQIRAALAKAKGA